MTAEQKLKLMKQEYDIPVDRHGIRDEVKVMCNLSEGVEEMGYVKENVETYLQLFKDVAPDVTGIRFLKEAGADESVLTLKSLEAFARAADGKATKIIIPSDIQGIAGLASSLKEIVTDPKAETDK